MTPFRPWQIRHLRLEEPLPDLAREPGTGGVYAVFWWRDLPLGQEMIERERLPMPAAQLRELALAVVTPAVRAYLAGWGTDESYRAPLTLTDPAAFAPPRPFDELEALMAPAPSGLSLSVVVCTRGRTGQLERCLRSLLEQRLKPREIIVVDNDPASGEVRSLLERMPSLRYVPEPRPGLDVARNTGVRQSSGDLIAFADDDVVAHPDWLLRLQAPFGDPKVMAVTGLVLALSLETEAQWLFERDASFNRGYYRLCFGPQFFARHRRHGVPVWLLGAGANMAFRRKAFSLLGLFDERLDAGAAGVAGDSEFWYRLLAEGWCCRYEPAAVVYHEHRSDMGKLGQQMYYYMRGHVTALLLQFERYGHWGNLYRAFVSLPRHYTKLLFKRLLRKRERGRLLGVEIKGFIDGFSYYLRHRRQPAVADAVLHEPPPSYQRSADA